MGKFQARQATMSYPSFNLCARYSEWSQTSFSLFIPWKGLLTIVHQVGCDQGPIWARTKKIAPHVGFEPRALQPKGSSFSYTDCVLPSYSLYILHVTWYVNGVRLQNLVKQVNVHSLCRFEQRKDSLMRHRPLVFKSNKQNVHISIFLGK